MVARALGPTPSYKARGKANSDPSRPISRLDPSSAHRAMQSHRPCSQDRTHPPNSPSLKPGYKGTTATFAAWRPGSIVQLNGWLDDSHIPISTALEELMLFSILAPFLHGSKLSLLLQAKDAVPKPRPPPQSNDFFVSGLVVQASTRQMDGGRKGPSAATRATIQMAMRLEVTARDLPEIAKLAAAAAAAARNNYCVYQSIRRLEWLESSSISDDVTRIIRVASAASAPCRLPQAVWLITSAWQGRRIAPRRLGGRTFKSLKSVREVVSHSPR